VFASLAYRGPGLRDLFVLPESPQRQGTAMAGIPGSPVTAAPQIGYVASCRLSCMESTTWRCILHI
jgi:hypothetical protein